MSPNSPLTPDSSAQSDSRSSGSTVASGNDLPGAQVRVNNLGFTDDQIIAGKESPSQYFQASIDNTTKTISVLINVKFDTSTLTGVQATQLMSLVSQGVNEYYSQTIDLNGTAYAVNVNTAQDDNGVPVSLQISQSQSQKRSYDSNGTLLGDVASFANFLGLPTPAPATIYYQPNYVSPAALAQDPNFVDDLFAVTAAHELGHAVLSAAGGYDFSFSHEGTSTDYGSQTSSTPLMPASGPIDLMKYYSNETGIDEIQRSQASTSDVKNLIYVSTRPSH